MIHSHVVHSQYRLSSFSRAQLQQAFEHEQQTHMNMLQMNSRLDTADTHGGAI